MQIEYFWRHELEHPVNDQTIAKGDLVILDHLILFELDGFFGVVIHRTASVVAAYTPAGAIVRKPAVRVQRVRLTRASKIWRDELLCTAVRTGVLVLSNDL